MGPPFSRALLRSLKWVHCRRKECNSKPRRHSNVIKREANSVQKKTVDARERKDSPSAWLCKHIFFANIRCAENSCLTNVSHRVLSSLFLGAVRLQLCPLRNPSSTTLLTMSLSARSSVQIQVNEVKHSSRACQLDGQIIYFSHIRFPSRFADGGSFICCFQRKINTISIFFSPSLYSMSITEVQYFKKML